MSRTLPIRTCVGCRERATKSDLVRVVVAANESHRSLIVDHDARAGRGAHLHPSLTCLELAERRRAFPRALRLEEAPDLSAIRSWVEAHVQRSPEALSTVGQKRSSSS